MQTGQALDPDKISLLKLRVRTEGRDETAKKIGVSPGTIRSALLGARLTAGVRTMIGLALASDAEERAAIAAIVAGAEARDARLAAMTPEQRRDHRREQEKRLVPNQHPDVELAERLNSQGAVHPDGGAWTPAKVRAQLDELNRAAEAADRAANELRRAASGARAMLATARRPSRARGRQSRRRSHAKRPKNNSDSDGPSDPDHPTGRAA